MENFENSLDRELQEFVKNKVELEKQNAKRFLGKLTRQECDNVIEAVSEDLSINNNATAFILIAVVLQLGGTNLGGIEQIQYTNGTHTLTAKRLNLIMSRLGKNYKPRKFARTMGNEIFKICMALGIDGDLANKRQLDVGYQSEEERVWCSNFQTSNPNCIQSVRDWLVDNYNKRFPNAR